MIAFSRLGFNPRAAWFFCFASLVVCRWACCTFSVRWPAGLTYLLSPTYRRHLRDNVRQAGLGGDVRRATIGEAGKQMLELARILSEAAG